MRAIWTGSIVFGLVNVPVKAYGATEDHDVSLHQVHDTDGGRIRYQRRCEVCGKKVDFDHLDKAYDDGERTVVLTDEDIESLPTEKSREIEVVQFVPTEQIDPIMFERSYYLEADSKSPKAYGLLTKTLKNTELTAVVKFALRQKTRLGALRVRNDVLVLQGILWSDEVRVTDFAYSAAKVKVSQQELKMSAALVDQFRGDFNPSDFEDDYQTELHELIETKLQEGDSLDTAATFGDKDVAAKNSENGGENVIDLMEALKRSVEQKRARNTEPKVAQNKSGPRNGPVQKEGARRAEGESPPKSSAKKADKAKIGARSDAKRSKGA